MDSRNRSSSAFLPGLVCAIGVAACVVGVRDIVSGEAFLFFGESGAESVSKLTGTRAYWWGGLCACWGISMIGLALVAPRAMEACTKRSSYCDLPRWQIIMLIGCLCMFMIANIGLVALSIEASQH